MAAINISLIQNKRVAYHIRQGNAFSVKLRGRLSDGTTPLPLTGYTFFAQIRDNTADAGGNVLITFTTTPTGGSYYIVNLVDALLDFRLSQTLTLSMKPPKIYYLEAKFINPDGDKVKSVVVEIHPHAEYARAVV